MLILLIRSHCKICPLPTMTISRVCTVGNCWQWAKFTMGPNGQNQHFADLRQKICLYIHAVVLLRGLPSLEGKNELFVGKKRKKLLAKSSQTDYSGSQHYTLLDFRLGMLTSFVVHRSVLHKSPSRLRNCTLLNCKHHNHRRSQIQHTLSVFIRPPSHVSPGNVESGGIR